MTIEARGLPRGRSWWRATRTPRCMQRPHLSTRSIDLVELRYFSIAAIFALISALVVR
jgi:hypothetical protein